MLLDRRVSVFTKIIPLLALIYLVSPVDFVADRIPILGQFDDLIVVGLLLLLFIAASPADVVADLTIGKKLRGLQKKEDPEGKTVDAKIRYIDKDEDESDSNEDGDNKNDDDADSRNR